MKDLTKVFINLSKCTDEERKLLPQILVKNRQKYTPAFNGSLSASDTVHFHNTWKRWALSLGIPDDKTEITYPDFIKLFDGGETIKSDNTQTLQNALQQIEKLEADKKELVEALQYVYGKYEKDGHLLNVSPSKIESLIQKMKP